MYLRYLAVYGLIPLCLYNKEVTCYESEDAMGEITITRERMVHGGFSTSQFMCKLILIIFFSGTQIRNIATPAIADLSHMWTHLTLVTWQLGVLLGGISGSR